MWSGQPYRVTPTWPHPARTRSPKAKPAAFRPIELGAALLLVAVIDVALWEDGRLSPGGFGFALLYGVLPPTLFVAARAWRGSVRLGILAGLLALVALRCAFAPSGGAVLAGLGLLVAFGLALRTRRVFVPEIVLSAVAAIAKLPSRAVAAAEGLQKLGARTRLGRMPVLPIVIPAALVATFLGVFALANPVVAHGLAAAWSAVARVVAIPSPGRIVLWTCALGFAVALLRP
ncbi:MAG TPA: hypothetical protein VM204_03845, partial [Gaiellaceae bacterium]|nr:hypothetical protein [Gaiellaceae bacterium]